MSSLPPVLYHYFSTPLPYARTLALQEQLHAIQLQHRRSSGTHRDILLLLQHRPVYTAGRRQVSTSPEVEVEAKRLRGIGADFVNTLRGGETTYHGPGQIVGYPLLDLGRWSPPMGIRSYICNMQKMLQTHLLEAHGIRYISSEHTGVFLDEQTKIASIGVQVRHRFTSHGFSMNITREPLAWFDRVVACGLADVKAGCIADAVKKDSSTITVEGEIEGLVERFGRVFQREMIKMDVNLAGIDLMGAIRAVEEDAEGAGGWLAGPAR
ncbi:chloroplast lipoate protein ligase [Sparassis latifolia]|uniref:lipoyl(octanoyl) transferase n=1 Tax=Sparassis crispa TaxID=139825 RepID=A0A401G8K6_9APHY|nr:Probable octanoyltransferase [Sparassis crispa]GBE78492.1 Probable octanoyltransferase [Sparassis crispa]